MTIFNIVIYTHHSADLPDCPRRGQAPALPGCGSFLRNFFGRFVNRPYCITIREPSTDCSAQKDRGRFLPALCFTERYDCSLRTNTAYKGDKFLLFVPCLFCILFLPKTQTALFGLGKVRLVGDFHRLAVCALLLENDDFIFRFEHILRQIQRHLRACRPIAP